MKYCKNNFYYNMSLFQKSVINKYLKNLDNEKVNKAFENF